MDASTQTAGHSDNQIVEDLTEKFPLLLFSLATQIQLQALVRTRKLIENSIRVVRSTDGSVSVDGDFSQAYDLFWLWTLGAYEVTRTMCQNKACFDPNLHHELLDLKRYLSELRMPFAKQELARTRQPISTEIAVVGIDERLGLKFAVRGLDYHSSAVMDRFTELILRIKPDQILSRID